MSRDIYNDTLISVDSSGVPTVLLSGVLVSVYAAGTTNLATIYQGRSGPTQQANPFTATNGLARFWADAGEYDVAYHDTLLRIADQAIGWNSIPAGTAGISGPMLVPGVAPPAGFIGPTAGVSEPPGWKLCNGQSLGKTAYAALYTALGGASSPWGQDTSTFRVPDLRGRTVIGAGTGAGLTTRTFGTTGGEENHLLTWDESGVNGNGSTGVQSAFHAHSGTTGTDSPDHSHVSTAPLIVHGGGVPPNKADLASGTALQGLNVNAGLGGATARHAHGFSPAPRTPTTATRSTPATPTRPTTSCSRGRR